MSDSASRRSVILRIGDARTRRILAQAPLNAKASKRLLPVFYYCLDCYPYWIATHSREAWRAGPRKVMPRAEPSSFDNHTDGRQSELQRTPAPTVEWLPASSAHMIHRRRSPAITGRDSLTEWGPIVLERGSDGTRCWPSAWPPAAERFGKPPSSLRSISE